MNYSKILDELNSASLFELYRLEQAIRHSLEDPARIRNIKNSLKVGQDIEYFDADENRLVEASIIELNRTRLLVRNRDDGKLWNIPYYHINLDHRSVAVLRVETAIAGHPPHRSGRDQFGHPVPR